MPALQDLEDELLRRFPEWRDDFNESFPEYKRDEDIGGYIIFGLYIEPRLMQLANLNCRADIEKLFDFFEQIATWDHASDELIHVELAEWLLEPATDRAYFEQFAGPKVLAAIVTMQDWRKNVQETKNHADQTHHRLP